MNRCLRCGNETGDRESMYCPICEDDEREYESERLESGDSGGGA